VNKKSLKIALAFALLVTAVISVYCFHALEAAEKPGKISDHFDGEFYFNPVAMQPSQGVAGNLPRRGGSGWIWRLLFGMDWPEWSPVQENSQGVKPPLRVPKGALQVIAVGHATFIIQMDGVNILTDPIWSERCSPVSWAGPKRFKPPAIRFEDLPPIDAVLISHNHYDHMDLPTLERLAGMGAQRAIVALGNRDLVAGTGMPRVDELDWWESIKISEDVTVHFVPARHFSSRSPWDRNKTLWGGFVISGPAGNVYFAGDTALGTHFREIARRFAPVRMAILPISPYRPQESKDQMSRNYSLVHMGPGEAVQAHEELGATVSIAAHFQVFQLGADGYYDAVNELPLVLKSRNLRPDDFLVPVLGTVIPASGRKAPSLSKEMKNRRDERS
jgi:L-ascorbate metabolism protein UlaG (beta-lactamase superfamily)